MKIKKAKKLLALAISAVMLISIVPMVASAAADLDIGTITMTGPVDGVLTVNVQYTATEVEQVTILAVVGSGDTEPTTIDNTNIAYIDQQASSATFFEFKVETSRFDAENNKLFIKMGGTALESAVPGATQEYIETPAGPVVTEANFPTVVVPKGTGVAYGVPDSKLIVIDINSLLTTGMGVSNDYKIVVRGAEFRYNPVNTKFFGTPIVGATPLAAADIIITKEARTVADIKFGDVNSNGSITSADLVLLKKRAGLDPTLLINGDMSGDVNLSGTITSADLVLLKKRAGLDLTPFAAEQ